MGRVDFKLEEKDYVKLVNAGYQWAHREGVLFKLSVFMRDEVVPAYLSSKQEPKLKKCVDKELSDLEPEDGVFA